MEQLEGIIISTALFITIAVIVIAILNFTLKNRLISSGQTDLDLLKTLGNSFNPKIAILKWGIILFFGGLGLVIINYIPAARVLDSPLPYGIEMIFLAGGFLCYFLVVRKSENK